MKILYLLRINSIFIAENITFKNNIMTQTKFEVLNNMSKNILEERIVLKSLEDNFLKKC